MTTPTYIYKIVPNDSPPPSPLPEVLPVSELDQSSGFIHLSTSTQVPGTLARFFSDVDSVWIIRICFKKVQPDIRWEDGAGIVSGDVGEKDFFPHLYNGQKLGEAQIDTVRVWVQEGGSWDTAVEKAAMDGWFIY